MNLRDWVLSRDDVRQTANLYNVKMMINPDPPLDWVIGHRIWGRFQETSKVLLGDKTVTHHLQVSKWGLTHSGWFVFSCKTPGEIPMSRTLQPLSVCIHVRRWHLSSIAGQLLHFEVGSPIWCALWLRKQYCSWKVEVWLFLCRET